MQSEVVVHTPEKVSLEEHLEQPATQEGNLIYDGEEEPEIHMRTWIALAAMWLLNLVQVFALQGPPAVVSRLSLVQNLPLTTTSSPTLEKTSTTLSSRHGSLIHSHSFRQSSAP